MYSLHCILTNILYTFNKSQLMQWETYKLSQEKNEIYFCQNKLIYFSRRIEIGHLLD